MHVPVRSATSNETGGLGLNFKLLLHYTFPLLTADELEEFNKVYDPSQFSSEKERIRAAEGEATFRCGVSHSLLTTFPDLVLIFSPSV